MNARWKSECYDETWRLIESFVICIGLAAVMIIGTVGYAAFRVHAKPVPALAGEK